MITAVAIRASELDQRRCVHRLDVGMAANAAFTLSIRLELRLRHQITA
jgi:hypothetical protein